MARFAHLGEISRSRRYMLGRAQSLAIAIDRIDRFSCSHNRGVATVASVRAMVVASRRGGQPSEVRGSTLTHPQPCLLYTSDAADD